jgi:hypothetical protein
MNLFRSEEHARNWAGFGDEGGLLTLEGVRAIWSTARYRERLNGHYISSMADYAKEVNEVRKKVTNDHPFWSPN